MSGAPSIDSIPVAFTPPGGFTDWPEPILDGCVEPLPDAAPDLRGVWQVVEIRVGDELDDQHAMIGHISRIEQAGDRIVITAGGVIHDMRCDGSLENGVHDVAAGDFSTEVHVVATYEDGVHVLRPDGLPIEIRRWRENDALVWHYVGFVARLRRLGDPDSDPTTLVDASGE